MRSEARVGLARVVWWMTALAGVTTSAVAQGPAPVLATYERYEQPAECIAAAERETRGYWRLRRQDTLSYHPMPDTLPTVVVTTARLCGARFRPATVPMGALLDLARLAFMAGRDDVVTAAIDRRIAHAPTVDEKVNVLAEVVSWLADARPTHAALTTRYEVQLDALGARAAFARMFAHTAVRNAASVDGDFSRVEREARAQIALYTADPVLRRDSLAYGGQWGWGDAAGAFLALAEGAWLLHGAAGLQAMSDTAMATLGSQHNGNIVATFLIPFLGHPLPSLPPVMRAGSDSTGPVPPPGRVTLIASRCLGTAVDGQDDQQCYSEYASQRRLVAAAGGRGLAVVTVRGTKGYFRNSAPLTPAQEADSVRQFVQEHFPLPGPLLMTETTFTQIDDGRFIPQQTSMGYGDFLVGPDGSVQHYGVLGWPSWGDALYEGVLQHLLSATHGVEKDSHVQQ